MDCVVREIHEELSYYLPPERFERIARVNRSPRLTKANPPVRTEGLTSAYLRPRPSFGALRLILRSTAHDHHVAVRIMASFDPASDREPNEGRCG